ncbi:unnamed protein product, partial [Clonostachys solani]
MPVIQRALDSGLDVVRIHHLPLAIRHGPDDLFTRLWENKAEHGGVPGPNTYLRCDGALRGETLFNTARYCGKYDAIKTLLEAGGGYYTDRAEALWDAARDGSHQLVKLLLEHGAYAMLERYHKISPLSVTAGRHPRRCGTPWCGGCDHKDMNNRDGCLETARLLLQHGVEIEHRDDEGRTALHSAVAAGDCQMVELLASYGADPTARISINGPTTLHTASLYVGRLDMTELLLRLGVDASAVDGYGRSPLWMARSVKEPVPIAKVLLESGASMEADRDGNTPLHDAASNGSLKLAEFLIVEHGADVNAANRLGETPFHEAVGHINPREIVKLLVDHGAETTMTKSSSRTLLGVVRNRTADAIRVMLENVANVKDIMGWQYLKDVMGLQKSMLHAALARGSQEIIDLMIQFGGHEGYLAITGGGRLHQGAITGDIALMQSVLDEGAPIDADRDNQGRTALVVAVKVGATASIEWLLKKGANANTRDDVWPKPTPLHLATGRNAIPAVGLLLKHGARVGLRDKDGQTALHMASRSVGLEILSRFCAPVAR